jgi:hypothetical protein
LNGIEHVCVWIFLTLIDISLTALHNNNNKTTTTTTKQQDNNTTTTSTRTHSYVRVSRQRLATASQTLSLPDGQLAAARLKQAREVRSKEKAKG